MKELAKPQIITLNENIGYSFIPVLVTILPDSEQSKNLNSIELDKLLKEGKSIKCNLPFSYDDGELHFYREDIDTWTLNECIPYIEFDNGDSVFYKIGKEELNENSKS